MKSNKNKYKGLIATVIFHVGIILLLIFFGFSTPLPLPGEEGVEVNLGYLDEGSGIIQPIKPIIPEKSTPPPPKQIEQKQEIATQDIEEAPIIEETKPDIEETKEKTIEQPKEIAKEEPKVNPAAMYKGKSKSAAEPGNEGITGKEGDQGKPSGTKESKNYLGKGGFGNGPSASLSGRTPKYLPTPSRHFKETGTVVVQIDVNKYGKVIKAIAIDRGSTTTNSQLRKMAVEAAKQAIFNANPNAAEMQRGTITYHFVIKN
ncbi:MAG: TonB family protein [Chlorobi bacterium]|nr:TonB family protein [Chlorobiota bacterium]